MDRAPPQQKGMMLAVAGALALGAAGLYYSRPKSGVSPEAAAQNDLRADDKKVDANPTAQKVGDVRENAK
ncbi:hypothetical protein EVJ58_g3396 [Rhodofomes roseus]|uniref:Uncharacterized protein n=1 Tax=Rhodofomes roseus TaxID=34475 RepID=A0A4Y9YNV2_9APHY|nr:hypothetical protein EVJ58_g3396 [Rhodofomes roseus]